VTCWEADSVPTACAAKIIVGDDSAIIAGKAPYALRVTSEELTPPPFAPTENVPARGPSVAPGVTVIEPVQEAPAAS